ncbi:high-potential iron-sulfur protein [Methylocystis sp. SC2]|uniref:high-potential iron-sulfur protein n=1 Tax=Methylocystis sp. (strain SC2) TaxID=187303 RepID=UPI00027AF05A|nr:high-potential iron-sulfur protein [Methylocystis sp. SC2]CCJ07691.1 High-potential iron-sulfur protein [Methylocystis sp. SC2]
MVGFRARTRRSLLALLGAAIAGIGAATPARARTSKAAAAYRGAPNGRQSCANCSYFNPPSGCGVVSGAVSARGWCNLWG